MVCVDQKRALRSNWRVVVAVLFMLLLGSIGCATAPSRPPLQSARTLPSGAEYITKLAYNDYGEEWDDTKSIAADHVRNTFEGALSSRSRASIRHDSRLDQVAALLSLARVWDGAVPVSSLIRWYFWRQGCIHQYVGHVTWSAAGPEGSTILSEALQKYAAEMDITESTSYGVYSFYNEEQYNGRPRLVWGQAVVFARRMLRMKPLPKKYPVSAPIELEFQFVDDFFDPQFYIDELDGKVLEQAIPQMPAPPNTSGQSVAPRATFSIHYQAPERPGRYFIEVTAREPLRMATDKDNPWRRSVLWLPIYVGIDEPQVPDDFIQKPLPNPEYGEWIPTILAAYNKVRAEHGLPPIKPHAGLRELAQVRSVKAGDASIELPPDSKLAEKIRRAGLPANQYYQTQGTFERLSEHIKLSLLRPASRFRIMSQDPPWIGLGIAPVTTNPKNIHENAVVTYTVQPVDKLDVEIFKKRILEGLRRARKGAGLLTYQSDANLSAAAQTFADSVCKGTYLPTETSKAWDLVEPKIRARVMMGSLQVQSYEVSNGTIEGIYGKIDAFADHLAVGACQGDLPGRPQATYTLILYYGASKSQ